jgi:hypothetical protein
MFWQAHLKIYFSHASDSSFARAISNALKSGKDFDIIFPHERSSEPCSIRPLLETGAIDLVLAEVSCPSTGQGIELAWADAANISIICVYEHTQKPSSSLAMIRTRVMPYRNTEEVLDLITSLKI